MTQLKGFISYSHHDRLRAAEVKSALGKLGVDAFMAHDDIHVSQQWRDRILDELRAMEVFVPLLSPQFKSSEWTAQEVVFALSRPEVLIIPASLDGTIPGGFLNALQARLLPEPADAAFFRDSIAGRFPRAVVGALIDALEGAGGWRAAEALFRPLLPYLSQLTPAEATRIAQTSAENSQIWDAGLCRSVYLPDFLSKNRHQIPQVLLDALDYQIETGVEYRAPEA